VDGNNNKGNSGNGLSHIERRLPPEIYDEEKIGKHDNKRQVSMDE